RPCPSSRSRPRSPSRPRSRCRRRPSCPATSAYPSIRRAATPRPRGNSTKLDASSGEATTDRRGPPRIIPASFAPKPRDSLVRSPPESDVDAVHDLGEQSGRKLAYSLGQEIPINGDNLRSVRDGVLG